MSFSYVASLPTTRDWVRFRLGDTTENGRLLEDEEINAIVAEGGARELAAAKCADAIAAELIRETDRSGIGKSVTGKNTQADKFKELAKCLRAEIGTTSTIEPYIGGQSQSEKNALNANLDAIKPCFSRGMWDRTGGAGGGGTGGIGF